MSERIPAQVAPSRLTSPDMYDALHPAFLNTPNFDAHTPSTGNEYRVIPTANLFFKHLLEQIGEATDTIDLQFYTLEADTQVLPIINAAMDAAQTGVRVRMLVDHLASDPRRLLSSALVRRKANQLPTMTVKTIEQPKHARGSLANRDHKKIVAIDGGQAHGRAYIGGINLADRSLRWNDFMIALRGPIARCVQQDFDDSWEARNTTAKLITDIGEPGTHLLTDTKTDQQILPFALQSIRQATDRIWLETPYLDVAGIGQALIAAKRERPSLDVRVIVPRFNIYPVHRLKGTRMLDPLARAGIETHRYGVTYRRLNHPKLLLADRVAMFGSSNFNASSMAGGNAEIIVATTNPNIVQQLDTWYQEDLRESRQHPQA